MKIELHDYWMGRDSRYRGELTREIQLNAEALLGRVNALLARMVEEGVGLDINPQTGSLVNSGWRPLAINAVTPGAALRSKHLTGQAIDLADPDGDLDHWCEHNLQALARVGLWLEHPAASKGWCHLQSVAPKSGKRMFYP